MILRDDCRCFQTCFLKRVLNSESEGGDLNTRYEIEPQGGPLECRSFSLSFSHNSQGLPWHNNCYTPVDIKI